MFQGRAWQPPRSTRVAVDAMGNLYVADSGNNRVLEYDHPYASCASFPDRVARQGGVRTGFRPTRFGRQDDRQHTREGTNRLQSTAVALDGQNNLFVADRDNNRVLKFTKPLDIPGSPNVTAGAVFGQNTFLDRAVGLVRELCPRPRA